MGRGGVEIETWFDGGRKFDYFVERDVREILDGFQVGVVKDSRRDSFEELGDGGGLPRIEVHESEVATVVIFNSLIRYRE